MTGKGSQDISDLPLEVQLVLGVKGCRTCKWFWGNDIPYGPYPSYDFVEEYPEEVISKYDTKNRNPIRWMTVRTKGQGLIEPAVMSGCRKAPIMTIGINPNITAFWSGPKNDTWAYPVFDKESSYAYYHRYKTIYQESFSQEFLSKHLAADGRLVADDDGWLIDVSRSNTSRWMLLTIQYKGRDGPDFVEISWKPEEDYMVNYNKTGKKLDAVQFKKGATIAAKLDLAKGAEAEIYHNITGYYERFTYVLDHFKKLLVADAEERGSAADLADVNFTIGEDVSQNDMIACASPGWTSIYDIPNKRVVKNCVEDNSWVVKQVIQSQPKVIVLVGASSLSMFLGVFGKYARLDTDVKDYLQMVRRTCLNKHYLNVRAGKFFFRSRLICSPHFSYPDGFKKQFKFLDEEWKTFESMFPADCKKLQASKKIEAADSYDGSKVIFVRDESVLEDLNADASIMLRAHFYDVVRLMAEAIKQEYDEGNLEIDAKTGHLKRTEGPCHFCKNDRWQFQHGCEYEKTDEAPYPRGYLQGIVEEVLKRSKTDVFSDRSEEASKERKRRNADDIVRS